MGPMRDVRFTQYTRQFSFVTSTKEVVIVRVIHNLSMHDVIFVRCRSFCFLRPSGAAVLTSYQHESWRSRIITQKRNSHHKP